MTDHPCMWIFDDPADQQAWDELQDRLEEHDRQQATRDREREKAE